MDSHEFKIFPIKPTKLLKFSKVDMVCVDFFLNWDITRQRRWRFLIFDSAEFALFPRGQTTRRFRWYQIVAILKGHFRECVRNGGLRRYDWATRLDINCRRGSILTQVFQWRRCICLWNCIRRAANIFFDVGVGKDSGMLLHSDWVIKVVTDPEIDNVFNDLLLSGSIRPRRESGRLLLMFLNTHTIYGHVIMLSWSIYFIYNVVLVKIVILLINRCLTCLKFITSLVIGYQVFITCNLWMGLIKTQGIDRLNDLEVIWACSRVSL